jgi:hypothetical protein
MAENKTKPTQDKPSAYVAAIADASRRRDCEALRARLGKQKLGKGCLFVGRLADIDIKVLERLVAQSIKSKQASTQPSSIRQKQE